MCERQIDGVFRKRPLTVKGIFLNRISILRAVSALTMFCAIVGLHLSGVTPVVFTTCLAIMLSSGFIAHSLQPRGTQATPYSAANPVVLVPPISESLEQLHELQAEINCLQAEFARDNSANSARDR